MAPHPGPLLTTTKVLGSSDGMDMSFPRDGGDWGSPSPLTDIGPEDSVSNTLVGQETTPPRGKSLALILGYPLICNQTQSQRSQDYRRQQNPSHPPA